VGRGSGLGDFNSKFKIQNLEFSEEPGSAFSIDGTQIGLIGLIFADII
jgi:hypothetical protein